MRLVWLLLRTLASETDGLAKPIAREGGYARAIGVVVLAVIVRRADGAAQLFSHELTAGQQTVCQD